LFYMKFCRPRPDSPLVFQARQGGAWITASADLKMYLTTKGTIDCQRICSNGRFVHGSRHLSLAVFAILAAFDVGKIRNYALLMRHSLATIEHVYSPWLKLQQAQVATQDLLRLRGETCPQASPAEFRALPLRPPSLRLVTYLAQLVHAEFTSTQYQPCFPTQSIGTQTEEQTEEQDGRYGRTLLSTEDRILCPHCTQPTTLRGPYANKKHMGLFGRYYRLCLACHEPGTRFYLLGFKPSTEHSTSAKPRNLSAIQDHLDQQK
jgi:hypothetical protein